MNPDLDMKIIQKMFTRILSELYHTLYIFYTDIDGTQQIQPISENHVNDNTIKVTAYKYYTLEASRPDDSIRRTSFVISKYSDVSKKNKIVTYSGTLYPLIAPDGSGTVQQGFYADIRCDMSQYKKTVLNLSINFEAQYESDNHDIYNFISVDPQTFLIKENEHA